MGLKRSTIFFIFENREFSIDFEKTDYKPTTTVLEFLRSLPNHKGVKEGCGQGDCGACSIVLAELDGNDGIIYKAVDACILFLPALHGKWLITVEDVGNSKNLHPIQRALIEHHGSQCGFCTPGFVMAMFALYKSTRNPDRKEIEEYLSGNLCRCTGYQSIFEAAENVCKLPESDHFKELEPYIAKVLKKINALRKPIRIRKKEQTYYIPFKYSDALNFKSKYPEALIINGSTDVALRVTKRKEVLSCVLDLSHIEKIKKIKEKNNTFQIGSGCNLEAIRLYFTNRLPVFAEMFNYFGSKQIRNVATIGGNTGTASPISDTLPVLLALNAVIEIQSSVEKRKVPVSDFIKGYRKTDMQPYEIITSIIIPKPKPDEIIKAYKVSKRKYLDISTVSACFKLKLSAQNRIEYISLFYGGMAEIPKPAKEAETFLINNHWTREIVEKAMLLIKNEFTPISDARSGADGRTIMAANLLLKFWKDSESIH